MSTRQRLARQQAALAEIARRALAPAELGALLQEAVVLVSETLGVSEVSVLELAPEGPDVRLRAGVGWEEGAIGHRVDAMPGGFVAHTLAADAPVVVEDLLEERRFATSPVLLARGVRSSVACRIPGPQERPFGVVGAHAAEPGRFGGEAAGFLAAVAGILASVIARHRRAVEINDEILQTLVLARYALDGGSGDARALVDQAVRRTRGLIGELLGGEAGAASTALPGDLRRAAPADVSDRGA